MGVVWVVEGIVLGGRKRAAAHRYGAHIGIEGCVGDGRGVWWWWKGLRHVLLIVLCCEVPAGESQACGLPPNFKFYGGPNIELAHSLLSHA